VIAALARNLLRWTSLLGLPGQTMRHRTNDAPAVADYARALARTARR
jgi:hypothetical protein